MVSIQMKTAFIWSVILIFFSFAFVLLNRLKEIMIFRLVCGGLRTIKVTRIIKDTPFYGICFVSRAIIFLEN